MSTDGGAAATATARREPPAPGAVRAFEFPRYLRRRLSNGLTVLAARSERAPLVALGLVFPAGGVNDPAAASGVAALTAALLDEGTADADARRIAARAADLGGSLTSGANWDVGYLEIEVLRHQVPEALALLAELASGPTFPVAELERQRRRHLAELLRRRSDPARRADERLVQTLYPDTPYGRTLLGDAASLPAISRGDVESFFFRQYPLSAAFLIAAGDLVPEGFCGAAESVLGTLAAGQAPSAVQVAPVPLAGIRVEILDRPRAAQTELRLGHAGVPRHHPDYLTLAVMNGILGGKFTSRINLNLRERNGYTYGANSQFSARRGPGPFVVGTAVATAVAGAAVREVLGELARIRDAAVEPEELADARSYLVGTFPYTLQTVSGLADRLETIAVYDLPADYYRRFPETIAAVTRDDVLAAARHHLHPDALAVVAVGPAAELESQLAELGTVRVHPAPETA